MAERIAIVSPWYPTRQRPFHGAFVRGFADAVAHELDRGVDVLHLEAWGLPAGRWAQDRATRSLARLVVDPFAFDSSGDPVVVRHLPAPVRPGQEFGPIAAEQRRFLKTVRRGRSLPHRIVHAHVGLGGGWPALEVLDRGSRLFVTEHATFLERIFSDPGSVARYDEVIRSSSAFLCVSDLLREQVIARFPHHQDKVRVVANPIDFDTLPVRVRTVRPPRRWIYAGSLTERKGVLRLLETFALAFGRYRDLHLTMVGDGPERAALEARIGHLGLDDHVTLAGSVRPEEMPALYAAHDLLVHLSSYETFGMTLVEAVATGIPVLVTRCGGPEETIAPIEPIVGKLVPVDAAPAEIADAYGELRDTHRDLDLAAGRADLRARYGAAAVAGALAAFYDGQEP